MFSTCCDIYNEVVFLQADSVSFGLVAPPDDDVD